jgi:regulator of sigma E protease
MFLSISSFMNIIWSILIALSALLIMIMVHELGHYLAGKLLGFKINEYSIGFGPAIFKRKAKSGELFSVRIIPLGGYCLFLGEDEENPSEDAFNNQKPWKRIIVLVSGVLFNFLTAIIVFTLFFSIYGYSVPSVTDTYELTSGEENALKKDDLIIKVNGRNVYSIYQSNLSSLIENADETMRITVLRDGERVEITAKKQEYNFVNEENEQEVRTGLGIQIKFVAHRFNILGSFGRAIVSCYQIIELIFSTLGKIFTGLMGVKGNLGGPITTIVAISTTTSTYGISGYLSVLAVISVSIGFTNLLPIPALDGSRVIFTIIEWIRKKPINRKVEGMIHAVGLIVLFSLTILLDLLNLFNR